MKLLKTTLFILILAPTLAFPAMAESAEKILEAAENIRHPNADYRVTVILESSQIKSGKTKTNVKEFETLIKGKDKALVKYTKPVSDLGKQVLMVESDMWIFMPRSAKPIRVSPKQKVSGNAAYGDIARLNFVGNYTPKLIKTEKFEGQNAHFLSLTAIPGKAVTYSQIEYIVNAISNKPLKAIYKTKAGKPLREGYFEDYLNVFGVSRPTSMRMLDLIRKGNTTVIKFVNATKTKLPNLLFKKQNMGRG